MGHLESGDFVWWQDGRDGPAQSLCLLPLASTLLGTYPWGASGSWGRTWGIKTMSI